MSRLGHSPAGFVPNTLLFFRRPQSASRESEGKQHQWASLQVCGFSHPGPGASHFDCGATSNERRRRFWLIIFSKQQNNTESSFHRLSFWSLCAARQSQFERITVAQSRSSCVANVKTWEERGNPPLKKHHLKSHWMGTHHRNKATSTVYSSFSCCVALNSFDLENKNVTNKPSQSETDTHESRACSFINGVATLKKRLCSWSGCSTNPCLTVMHSPTNHQVHFMTAESSVITTHKTALLHTPLHQTTSESHVI